MLLTKRINHNAAFAQDSSGRELIVMGKGIGFPPMPYELEDLSKIQRTFYDVAVQYGDMAANLPEGILLVSAEIAEQAALELDCELC